MSTMHIVSFVLVLTSSLHVTQGTIEDTFLTFFQFNETQLSNIESQVNVKHLVRIEDHARDVTLDKCRLNCLHDLTCHGAVYSEATSAGCFPQNCTGNLPRGVGGVCHRLSKGTRNSVMDFRNDLEGDRRNYLLLTAQHCNPFGMSLDEQSFENARVSEVEQAESKDDIGVACYIFTHECPLGYVTADSSRSSTFQCCDDTAAVPTMFRHTVKCTKSEA